MTIQEQTLADDKMRTEIAKLITETKQNNISRFIALTLTAATLMGAGTAFAKLVL